VGDPRGEALDEGQAPERATPLSSEFVGIVKEGSMAFVHFDPVTGVATCLRAEEGDTDFGLECHNCGAVTLLGLNRCPICGHDFDEDDTGLIGLLEGLKFDLDDDKELDCPSCGEHIVIDGGRCPSCKEIITLRFARGPDAGVRSVLKERNVVFVHLDVTNGDLWFSTKLRPRKAEVNQSVHLDSISKGSFVDNWKSLARI
jgi:hypothetical protein